MNEEPVEIELHDLMAFRVYTRWSQKGCGFGELSVSVKRDGNDMVVSGDTESMGREWVRKALHAAVDKVVNSMPEEGLEFADARIPIPPEVLEHWAKIEGMEAFSQIPEVALAVGAGPGIRLMPQDKVTEYHEEVARILEALEHPEALVTDASTFLDFIEMDVPHPQWAVDEWMKPLRLEGITPATKLWEAAKLLREKGDAT